MKTLFFLLFFIGWTMVIVGYSQNYQVCPPKSVEYRYLPRQIIDEQLSNDNTDVSSLFDKMVEYRDPLT